MSVETEAGALEGLIKAVEKAESSGRRYDERGNLLSSPKGARGEMQVLDKTMRRPGYGVEPAADASPDERARVGRDYLKAMVRRYGDTDHALVAYNWGPKRADEWIKAGAKREGLPDETKKYVERVSRFMGQGTGVKSASTAVPVQAERKDLAPLVKKAEAEAAPVSERAVVAENKYIESRPDVVAQAREYGPGYQAALALAALDEDDDDEEYTTKSGEPLMREKSAAQQFLETETPPQGLAGVDFKVKSPFPETARAPGNVALLAKGGEAKEGKQKPAGNAKSQLLQMKTQLGLQGAAVDDRLQGLGSAYTAFGNPAFTRRGDLSQDTMGVAHFDEGGMVRASEYDISGNSEEGIRGVEAYINPVTGEIYSNEKQGDSENGVTYTMVPTGRMSSNGKTAPVAGGISSVQTTTIPDGPIANWQSRIPSLGSLASVQTATIPDGPVANPKGPTANWSRPATFQNPANVLVPTHRPDIMAPIVRAEGSPETGETGAVSGNSAMKAEVPYKDQIAGWLRKTESVLSSPLGLVEVRDYASNRPKELGLKGELGGEADAMRHLLLSRELHTKYPNAAGPLLWVHEKVMPGQNPREERQDQFNNDLGKRLMQENPQATRDQFEQRALQAIQSREADVGAQRSIQKPVRKRADGSPQTGESSASMMDRLKGYGETAASIGSGVLSSIPAGYAGLKELAVSRDPARAAQEVQRVQEAGTYVPRGTSGKESLSKAAEMLELLNVPAQKVGEAAFRASGNSPLVGAAAETVLDPLNFVPGAKAIKGFPKAVKEAAFAAYGAGPTGTASHVIRPVGGSFPSAKSVEEFPVSHLDDFILNSVEKIQQRYPEGPARKTLEDMFDKKARDYFRTTAGSIADPLREMFLENKLPAQEKTPLGETIPSYLREAARKGNPQAMQALEQEYGKLLNMQVTRRSPDLESAKASTSQDILKQMQEQPQLIPDATLVSLMRDPTALSKKEVKEYATKIRQRMKDNPEFFSAVLERKAEYLPTKTESYTEGFKSREEMQPYANIYPPVMTAKDLPAHLQHEVDTAIEKQQPIMDLKGHYKALGLDTEDYLKAADSISAKDLSQMSFPDFVAKAYNLNAQTATIKNLATTAQKLITEKKPFPKEIKDFGVKEVAQAPDGYRWVQVTNPDATIIQGKLMDNSIAGYSRSGTYGPLKTGRQGITDGKLNVFVLQDPKGYPVVNADYIPGLQELHQMTGNGTGTGNAIPVLYSDKIQSLFDALEKRGDYVKTMPTSIENLMLGLD